MKRKSPYQLTKVTINLRAGDPDFIHEHFPELGYSLAIRQIVAAWVDRIKAEKVAKGIEEVEAINV